MVMQKKGAINVDVVVKGIILLFGFVIVLGFLGGAWWYLYGSVEGLTCETSIEERHTFNFGPFEPGKNIIPLKCETKQVCFSNGGGSCESVFGKAGDENSVTRKTIPRGEDAHDYILDYIAEGLFDYHTTLGQGKLNFMPRDDFDSNYCLIGSWIALEDDLNDVSDIGYGELYAYLENKKTNSGKSYLSYIYPGWENAEVARILFEKAQEEDDVYVDKKFEDWKIDLDYSNGNMIIAQMRTEGLWEQYVATGAVVGIIGAATIGSIFTGGLSLTAIPFAMGIASAGLGGAVVLGGVTYVVTTPDETAQYTSPMVFQANIDTLRNIQCSSFALAP